ncbi:MAG TPA: VWA domain-containing protein [Acidimicrobiales bacterium]|nr:VWA domain-containing protein [Acidimicrobiales bacterium]
MTERLRRWRLVLGGDADGTGMALDGADAGRDAVLDSLYGAGDRGGAQPAAPRSAGLGGSAPRVARWLGDIRTYFPSSVVRVLQQDAMDRLGLRELLLEPELLDAVQPDVSLVATLVSLGSVIPAHSRETARSVVRQVVEELERRFRQRTVGAVRGALDRATRVRRPRPSDIDWDRTIRANLRHYQPAWNTVIPERLVGFARRHHAVEREVVLCVDQSGSMASSVVYASVFAAVLGSMRSLRTSVVVFDTAVVDLTEKLADPVELLFATQLGGGTDINRAVAYCQGLVTRPADTVMVLLSDLFEGGDRDELVRRLGALVHAGVTVVALLALDDRGAPAYDHNLAHALAALGIVAFACTPDRFPDLMAAAVERRDLSAWAAAEGIVTAAPAS